MKICTEAGCQNPQFGGFKCRYHQYIRHMRGGDLYKPKKRQKTIPKESTKRKKEHKTYLQKISEFWDKSVENNENKCFFCGEKMEKRENIHHVRGRGNFYLEEEFWVNAHQDCHNDYHFLAVEKLRKKEWFNDFLNRLKIKDLSSYYKLINRINKAELEFET